MLPTHHLSVLRDGWLVTTPLRAPVQRGSSQTAAGINTWLSQAAHSSTLEHRWGGTQRTPDFPITLSQPVPLVCWRPRSQRQRRNSSSTHWYLSFYSSMQPVLVTRCYSIC